MPKFIELVAIPILATVVCATIILNPFRFDWQQRVSLLIAVLAFAFFLAYTIHKTQSKNRISPGIRQISYGTGSPNVIGDGNSINGK